MPPFDFPIPPPGTVVLPSFPAVISIPFIVTTTFVQPTSVHIGWLHGTPLFTVFVTNRRDPTTAVKDPSPTGTRGSSPPPKNTEDPKPTEAALNTAAPASTVSLPTTTPFSRDGGSQPVPTVPSHASSVPSHSTVHAAGVTTSTVSTVEGTQAILQPHNSPGAPIGLAVGLAILGMVILAGILIGIFIIRKRRKAVARMREQLRLNWPRRGNYDMSWPALDSKLPPRV